MDFSHYKPTTLRRRMQRRAVLRRAASLHDYADLVTSEPAEAEALSEEVLIHVTSFFRDAEVFEALKKEIFPRLLANRRTDALRVWVPGCSSGEEVYSIAICLAEFLAVAGASQIPVKMFGTDVESASDRARARRRVPREHRRGRLAGATVALLSEDRARLRNPEGGARPLRLRDPRHRARPAVLQDGFISCRNLMIYLGPTLQQRILPMFHYALNEPGFLVLGTAETIGAFAGFTAADAKNRIYARSPGPVRVTFDFGEARGWSAPSHAFAPALDRPTNVGDVRRDADRAILSAIAPAGVVVTNDLAIIEFRGEIAPYLEPIPGVATLDLLRMAREELRLTLRRAIDEARSAGKPARAAGVIIGSGDERRSVDVNVIPFTVAPASTRFFAVLFAERAASPPGPAEAVPEDVSRAATEDALRHELASTRDYLQSVIEQLEAGNEEMKAANEEIVSSNEELQSTNEELQTAKEELQATNEELRTVNDEMLDRNVEATRLADDLSNILSSVAIPIVILGRESRIRRFTPSATKILNLIPTDVGRPVTDIQAKIRIPEPDDPGVGRPRAPGAAREDGPGGRRALVPARNSPVPDDGQPHRRRRPQRLRHRRAQEGRATARRGARLRREHRLHDAREPRRARRRSPRPVGEPRVPGLLQAPVRGDAWDVASTPSALRRGTCPSLRASSRRSRAAASESTTSSTITICPGSARAPSSRAAVTWQRPAGSS